MCRGVGDFRGGVCNTGAFVSVGDGEHVNGGEQFSQMGRMMKLQQRGGDGSLCGCQCWSKGEFWSADRLR